MPEPISLVIHATHEAGVKVGGIGAVLDGLLRASTYNEAVARTILVGPMYGWDAVQMERLNSPRNQLTLRYSSLHAVFDGVEPQTAQALQRVEQTYQVAILYGSRRFGQYEHEILLVDASSPDMNQIDSYRYYVWQNYGIDSARYSHDSEFNLFFATAQPLFAALKALAVDVDIPPSERIIIAHEWLGMPLVFAVQMNEPRLWRTVFYAHEMATARLLVEEHGGHDTRFYNAMAQAAESGMNLDAVFGDQSYYFKHAIVRQATRCDNIFAVGDLVVDELRFLGGAFTHANIDLVYNGVIPETLSLQQKMESRQRLQQYCRNLLGFHPDYVFTHVTRMVLSKGMWRDTRVMEHLDRMLADTQKSAVLFLLSTSAPAGRRSEWVQAWEAQYGWPVGHRGDNGDLLGAEAAFFFNSVEPFNRSAQQSQMVFVNQFGWSQELCGQRMPAAMEFADIRRGSDLEFGQSIYEPFGIAQVEPLNYGALSCVSSVCGCIGFVERITADMVSEGLPADGASQSPNWVVADYVGLPEGQSLQTYHDALSIDQGMRDWIEQQNSVHTAWRIFRRLPQSDSDFAALLEIGEEMARRMSWDVVVERFFLPGLRRAQR